MKHFTKVTDYGIDFNVMEKSRNCFPLFLCESCVYCLSYFWIIKDNSFLISLLFFTSIEVQQNSYCICGGGEYGLMICCDGEKCPIVWYHADCVGLSEETVPAGSWFCKDCDH